MKVQMLVFDSSIVSLQLQKDLQFKPQLRLKQTWVVRSQYTQVATTSRPGKL